MENAKNTHLKIGIKPFLVKICYFADDKFPLQVAILNYMFPPKGRIRIKNKGHWKFSTIESFEGMIKLVKVQLFIY